jgi:hypothetical protein
VKSEKRMGQRQGDDEEIGEGLGSTIPTLHLDTGTSSLPNAPTRQGICLQTRALNPATHRRRPQHPNRIERGGDHSKRGWEHPTRDEGEGQGHLLGAIRCI